MTAINKEHEPLCFYYRDLDRGLLQRTIQVLSGIGVRNVRMPDGLDPHYITIKNGTMDFTEFDCIYALAGRKVWPPTYENIMETIEKEIKSLEQQALDEVRGIAATLQLDEQKTHLLATWFMHNRNS